MLPEENVPQDYVVKAKYRFHKKLDKLNKNYQNRSHNGLYLFLHPTDEECVDAQELFEYMKEQQEMKAVKFDWIFLNCIKVIYICDFRKNKLESIELPQNAENFLNTESEKLRHLKAWHDGEALDE